MPIFTIYTLDHAFVTETEVQDYQCSKDALSVGVRGALMMAIDAITNGGANTAVEVVVKDSDGRNLHKSIITLSVSKMVVDPIKDKTISVAANDF